ncbi:MAG TPA: Gfo/Idh/MocA family oxidoreductase [Granulicella sp.]
MTITRREFSRLAAASAATSFVPHAFGQSAQRIRYAIVGLGRISMQHFMPATKGSATTQVTALVSGHPEKARRVAAVYNIPESSIYSYENIGKLRDNPNVDAVYIALPNSMHAEYSIRSAEAGKHVLCEKPMATSVADAEAMIAACKKASRKLMIAYRMRLEPTTLRVREMIRSGQLGTVQGIESANGFNIRAGEWRLNGKLAGGGPLMDMGVYSLNGCQFLLGEEPTQMFATASVIDHDGRFDEVEENLSWTMKFPSGAVAACNTTYGAGMDGMMTIHGSKGWLRMQPAFSYDGLHLTGRINGKDIDEPVAAKDPSQFVREAEYFAKCITDNTTPEPSGEVGLRDMKLMMELYRLSGRIKA